MKMESTWKSPSNIALVKYWGKYGNQLPKNPSISFSLQNCFTQTSIKLKEKTSDEAISFSFRFGKEAQPKFEKRIKNYLEQLAPEISIISQYHLEIDSNNSFPHSAGIASSASAMGALALCLLDLERETKTSLQNESLFLRKASELARLGSGSAARSLYGGFNAWGNIPDLELSSNSYAIPINEQVHDNFKNIHDSVILVSNAEKKTSSTAGHQLMNKHAYAEARFQDARKNVRTLLSILKSGDWNAFIELMEYEALSLHAMMMSSQPGFLLMNPQTLDFIQKIRTFREERGIPVGFTMDAGPNIHLIYPEHVKESLAPLLNSIEEEGIQIIHDKIGTGPKSIS